MSLAPLSDTSQLELEASTPESWSHGEAMETQ